MKKRSILVVVLFLLTYNLTVLAQEEAEERDVAEVSFFGGTGVPAGGLSDWTTSDEERGAKTGWDIGIDAGYYLAPSLVVGLNLIYTQLSIKTDGEQSNHKHRLYNPNVYIKYLLEGESNWVPYVKGHIGVENPKFSTFVTNIQGNRYREISYDPSFGLGAGLGLFYYTADYSGLFLEANYHHAFTKDTKATYQDTDYIFGDDINVFDIHAGIRILIGSGG